MTKLTREEILEQLKKIGIHSSSDLDSYFKEYKDYYNRNLHIGTVQEHRKRMAANPRKPATLPRQITKVCCAIFPTLSNSLKLSRIKAYRLIKK